MKSQNKFQSNFIFLLSSLLLLSSVVFSQTSTKDKRIIKDSKLAKTEFIKADKLMSNLFDNAYDAMMQRKEELKEEGYVPTVSITAEILGNEAIVHFQDNGIGVKDDDREKLFTPFFTTKATSRKGTGLGLYVIRKIIEDNHGGKIEMSSHYREGTGFLLRIPAAAA